MIEMCVTNDFHTTVPKRDTFLGINFNDRRKEVHHSKKDRGSISSQKLIISFSFFNREVRCLLLPLLLPSQHLLRRRMPMPNTWCEKQQQPALICILDSRSYLEWLSSITLVSLYYFIFLKRCPRLHM